jgi:hypothetical protein
VTTLVHGCDIVPTFSTGAIDALRQEVCYCANRPTLVVPAAVGLAAWCHCEQAAHIPRVSSYTHKSIAGMQKAHLPLHAVPFSHQYPSYAPCCICRLSPVTCHL